MANFAYLSGWSFVSKFRRKELGFNKDYPVGFEQLWKVYPNKANKEGAYKSWKREGFSKQSENDLLINHVSERRKMDVMWLPDRDGKTFIPHLQTFINQRRWHDDYKKARSQVARHSKELEPEPEMTPEEKARADVARKKMLEQMRGLLGRRV